MRALSSLSPRLDGRACIALNAGGLPPGYFALSEQVAGGPIPDVLTLHRPAASTPQAGASAGVAVVVMAPHATYVQRIAIDPYAAKANRIVIRTPWATSSR